MLFGNARTLGKHRRPVLNPCIESPSLAKHQHPQGVKATSACTACNPGAHAARSDEDQ